MRRTIKITGIAVALAFGIAAGEVVFCSVACRDAMGRLFGRGELLALVYGKGIYEVDLQREADADSCVAGTVGRALDVSALREVLGRLIADENIRQLSENEPVSELEIKRELDLLYFEFADEKRWTNAMRMSGISGAFLDDELRSDLRARKWIEQRIAPEIKVEDESCRKYYVAHPADFVQPLRLRVSHLFLAAPAATPPEIVEAKREMIESLATRLAQGEDFSQLVAEASEDEATRLRSGDLGYLSHWRVPSEFFAAVSKYRVGETNKPFRSHLGFHIVRVTETKAVNEMAFDEARAEILCRLSDLRRQIAVENFAGAMSNRAEHVAR